MNSVMSPPATKPPRRRGPRGGRGRNNTNNTGGDQDAANHQTTTNRTPNTPRHTPSIAASPTAPQRQLYIPPPHTPSIPKVKILKPSAAPPAPPAPSTPAAPTVRTTLEIRGRQPPPAPIQTRPLPETTAIAVVDGDSDDKDNDKFSSPASPPPLASPKTAPAPPPPPPPFETPDHKTLIRDRQAQIAAYLSRWDTLFAIASAKSAGETEPNLGKRLPWTIENNSVDGAGWRPWGEYLHTGHRGT